ncbi:MAG: ABC transporter substrate-binding protein, partial [Salinirussus sp.]
MAPSTGDSGRHTRRDYLKVAGGVGAGSLIAGCMGGGGGGGGGSTFDLTIGGLIAQSGPLSFDGPNIPRGAEMAIEDFQAGRSNLDGNPQYVPDSQPESVGEVELLNRDTESAAEAGMRKTRELVNREEVDSLFGGYSSSFTVNLAQYAADEEILTVVPASANTRMTGEFRNKWFFHAFGNADQTSRAIG